MAVQRKRNALGTKNRVVMVLCSRCIHSGNRIERDVNGEFFMCWCPLHRWAQFLRQPHPCQEYEEGDPIPDEPDSFEHHKRK